MMYHFQDKLMKDTGTSVLVILLDPTLWRELATML